MKYPRSILKGYSGPVQKMVASALHMPLKGGGKMKIPMSVLKAGKKSNSGGKMKMSMLKNKDDKGYKKKGEDE